MGQSTNSIWNTHSFPQVELVSQDGSLSKTDSISEPERMFLKEGPDS